MDLNTHTPASPLLAKILKCSEGFRHDLMHDQQGTSKSPVGYEARTHRQRSGPLAYMTQPEQAHDPLPGSSSSLEHRNNY